MVNRWNASPRSEPNAPPFRFRPQGPGSTLVRLEQTGWKSGEEWDQAYDYLATGNAQLLAALRQRFVAGPTDWVKAGWIK